MKKELVIRSNSSAVDFALLNSGKLIELNKEIDSNKFSVGDIFISSIRKVTSPADVTAVVESLTDLKVLVIGETIIDQYIFCVTFSLYISLIFSKRFLAHVFPKRIDPPFLGRQLAAHYRRFLRNNAY